MITKGQARDFNRILNSDKVVGGMKGKVALKVYDRNNKLVDIKEIWDGYDVSDLMFNTSLETAKVIMSRVMAGDMDYKLAKVAFGNCGHDFDNPKRKVDATTSDIELQAARLIKDSLSDDDVDDFTYTYDDKKYRITYIEKDITTNNITFGADGRSFVVEMPISFGEFNLRDGADQDDNKNPYIDNLVSYDLVMPDGTLGKFRNIDSDGNIKDDGNFTEIKKGSDDDDNTTYQFKNGLDDDGNVDTDNGGIRPQEVSEILMCANITGDGSDDNPYKKYASSRITSGLLVFPEGFNFTYQWTLTWDLV